jgi:hypothetical protein
MDDPRAQRTLVKSPPELWAEVSDVGALAGHLGAFGEIRITRLEPETTVAWEGDRARGTVELEPSGWGTKVTLTAQMASEPPRDPEPAAAPEPEGATEPAAEDEVEPVTAPVAAPEPARRRGFFARLFGRRRDPQVLVPAPTPEPARESEVVTDDAPDTPTPVPLDAGRAEAILAGVLDDLGSAHHRPFSRG